MALFDIRAQAIVVIKEQGWDALPDTAYGQSKVRKTGRIGTEQAAYFRQAIEQNRQARWTFILMHKPVWQRSDEQNFATVETALQDQPYTVFYGHVHSYLHEERLGQDYIRLGTTGGAQVAGKDMAIDHVSLITVSGDGVDIANLRMSGIFDKSGKIPLNGEDLCFDVAICGEPTD
jgi:hypothetical protein